MTGVLEYSSNNSGGSWWLTDENWQALEQAGWVVHWIHDEDDPSHTHEPNEYESFTPHSHAYDEAHLLTAVQPNGERWLGALAKSAAISTDDPDAAIAEFERVTGMSASDEGCNCCGQPHYFTFRAEDGSTRSSSVEVVQTRRVWS